MVLEGESFIVKGISEKNATALKNTVLEALANDTSITEISVLVGEQNVQGSTTARVTSRTQTEQLIITLVCQ